MPQAPGQSMWGQVQAPALTRRAGDTHQPSIKEGAESWSSEGREGVTLTSRGAEHPKAPKGVAGCQAELWPDVRGRGLMGHVSVLRPCTPGEGSADVLTATWMTRKPGPRDPGAEPDSPGFGNGAGVLEGRIWADSQARVVRTGDEA